MIEEESAWFNPITLYFLFSSFLPEFIAGNSKGSCVGKCGVFREVSGCWAVVVVWRGVVRRVAEGPDWAGVPVGMLPFS